MALIYPLYAGVAFGTGTAEDLEDAFAGRKPIHAYSRITNPTVEALETKLSALEGGLGTIATALGMSAIANTFLALLRSGDTIVAADSLFGGTVSLFTKPLAPLGIAVRFVAIDDLDAVRTALHETGAKALYFETISNPKMGVAALAALARESGAVSVVDATVTTPYLARMKKFGVDVALHSPTKFVSDGVTSVGGAIFDSGNADWTKIKALGGCRKYQ